MKKAISLFLVLVMLIGMIPMQVFATEGTQETEPVEVVTEPAETTETPEEETEEITEETEEITEETEVPEPSEEEEKAETSDEAEEEEPSTPSEPEEVEVVHEHEYATAVTAPTCTEQGYTTYTCECGDSYVDDYVDADGEHDFTDWYTTKEAAYNADGEESRDCKKCSHVEFRSVELEVVTSGNVGKGTPYTDDVTYTLYADGTMVISGNGIVYCSDWRGDYQPYLDYRMQVKTLIVEEGITTTAGGCFAHFYNLETVSLPDSLTKIDGNAFMSSFSSSITSVTIPKTVTYIGAYSYGFYYGKGGTTFTDIIIENPNIRFVDNKAVFNAGNNLANLTLYSYGTNNNVSAYAEKYGCKYVDLEAYKTGIYSGVEYMYYDGVLNLSAAQNDATIAGEDAPWNTEKNNIQKIVIESGITGIAANAFKDYYNLESIEINNEICSVGDGAFSTTEACERALNLALPRTVKRVGSGIFAGRQNVTLTAYLGSAAAEINESGVTLDLKKQFKLLLIGNSYSEDASSCGQGMQDSQLLNMLQAMLGEDAEVTVALLSSGGKGINWHATQAEQGNAAYSFKIISSNSPTWTTIGSASSYQALTWTDWDVVSLQPYNISASTGIEAVAYPDGTDMKFRDLKTASEYMLDYIGTHAPDAEIYCYMHWAQTTGTTLNANLSSYNKLTRHYLGMMEHAGTTTGTKYTSIIPVGLSIQNARTTYLALLAYNIGATLNLTTDTQMGLQRDGGHLSFNVGRYIAGLTFAEMIVPNDWRVDNYVLPEIRITESVGKLPKEYSVIAQKAVLAAVNSWKQGSLSVTDIEGYTQDPTVAAKQNLEAKTWMVTCADQETMTKQLSQNMLVELPEDFAVDAVVMDWTAKTATVTVRFGYTAVNVTVSWEIEKHSYENGVCTGCGEAISLIKAYIGVSNTMGNTSGNMLEVIDFPALPYSVYEVAEGVYGLEDILSTKAEVLTAYYVDSKTGSDDNYGTSEDAPFRTLKKALTAAAGKAAEITILNENAVFFTDELYGNYAVNQTTVIKAKTGATILGGIRDAGFSMLDGYTNTYVSGDLSGYAIQTSDGVSAVVETDSRNVDEMGIYRALLPVASVEAVEETKGSYYYDAETAQMYVNPRYNIATVYPLSATYHFRFNLSKATGDTLLYLENLNVIGGFLLYGRSSADDGDSRNLEFVANNCTFQHDFVNNCVSVHNFNGSYMVDCRAGYSLLDGYNYHANHLTTAQRLKAIHVEVNCQAEDCGYYRMKFGVGTINNNLSTAHEGINVLRVNFSGHDSYGPQIADVNGCRSVNIDCTISNSYQYSGSAGNYQFTQTSATRKANITLIDCYAYDSRSGELRLYSNVERTTVVGGNLLEKNFYKVYGELLTEVQEHTHSYTEAVTVPTCTEQGYTTYTCACGDSYVDDYVDATGHTYKNGICTGCGRSVLDGNYTHAIPENQGVQNAIDRAYSLTDVEWTPLANVPGVKKINGEFTVVPFEAGVTYKGIPYSGVTANDCYVGLNVSLESFLAALENENSVLYTENLFSTNPKSATYFGTVCSKFAQYALDIPGSYNTNNIANIPGMETIALPGKYTVDQIKLGDVVLHTQDHTTVCTDILYDADGNVAFIEISEAVLPLCRRMYWSPEEFYEHFEGYRLCRYRYIGQTPAIDETKLADDYALMPRFGDKYNYKISSTKGIVDVLESGYHKAVILRDGVVIDEIILGGATAFKFDRSVPGYLEMYLEKQDGTRSGSVYACVVKSSVTVTNTSRFTQGNLTVTIDGSCGTPVYVQVGSAHAIFCNVEGKSGTVEISFPFSKVSSKQVRVAYQNEYGIYLSDWSGFPTASNTSQDAYLSQGTYWDGYTLTPSSHTPVVQSGKTSYWTYTMIPVEENTTYYSKGCNRMWFLDAKGNPISTFNANTESDVRFQFTTPVGTAYVSITYAPSGVDKGTETLVHVHTYEDGTCIECGHQNGPVITQQPESVQQEIGKKFAITVKAEGEGLTYQWYVKEAGAKEWKVSVNKTSSYAYTMQTYMHNRRVYCVITDANGNSVQTETATITRPPLELVITGQPQDAQVAIGEKFSIKPTVQGDGLTYQWYYKNSGGKSFAASSNKSSAYAYTMANYMAGRQVYCVITDQYGNEVTTDVATISLPPVELKILTQPTDVSAPLGAKFSVSFAVQGDGLTYQWYVKEAGAKAFKVSSNKTSAYAYNMANYMNGRQVYCVITDRYGNQVTTETVTIHVTK